MNGNLRLPSEQQPQQAAYRLLYMDETGAVKPVTDAILSSLRAYTYTDGPALPGCEEMFPHPTPIWQNGEGVIYTGQSACYYAPKVGINTNTPTADLHVAGRTTLGMDALDNTVLSVASWPNRTGVNIQAQASTTGLVAPSTLLSLQTQAADDVVLEATNFNGDRLLKVQGDGSLWATGVYVRLSEDFPDYVFEEGYRLMPLPELKAYILEHHHLPNMPSSTEVAEKGANLGEINRVLVEKVEELTLHVIALQEQLESLQKAKTEGGTKR